MRRNSPLSISPDRFILITALHSSSASVVVVVLVVVAELLSKALSSLL